MLSHSVPSFGCDVTRVWCLVGVMSHVFSRKFMFLYLLSLNYF